MTCEQAAWRVVARLEQHQEWLTWALFGASFLAGLLLLTAIHASRGGRP